MCCASVGVCARVPGDSRGKSGTFTGTWRGRAFCRHERGGARVSILTLSRKHARAAPPVPSHQDPLCSKAKGTTPGPCVPGCVAESVPGPGLGLGPTQTTGLSLDPAAAGSLGLENWTTERVPPRYSTELRSSGTATWRREQGGLPGKPASHSSRRYREGEGRGNWR